MTRSRKLLQRFTVTLLIVLALNAALLLSVAYWAKPKVIVQNHSAVTVQVEARWGPHRKQLPAIAPGAKRRFKVAGESSMVFVVTYPDGRQLHSLPVYFTTAMTVTAVVTDSTLGVTAEL